MADDEFHSIADELVGDRYAFLRVGAVVADEDLNLLPENAAGGVDVRDRLLDTVLELRPEGGAAAGDRPATPSLICAEALSAKARPRPKARPSVEPLSHSVSLWMDVVRRLFRTLRANRASNAPRGYGFKPQMGEKSPGF